MTPAAVLDRQMIIPSSKQVTIMASYRQSVHYDYQYLRNREFPTSVAGVLTAGRGGLLGLARVAERNETQRHVAELHAAHTCTPETKVQEDSKKCQGIWGRIGRLVQSGSIACDSQMSGCAGQRRLQTICELTGWSH